MRTSLPTDLVYINRKIDDVHVQTPGDYKVSSIDEFLEKDLQALVSLGGSIIRPILGMFGSGKTTVLNRIGTILPKVISREKYLLIRINLENVPVVQHEEFLKVIMKQIFPVLEADQLKVIFERTGEEALARIFQGIEIIKHIKNLHSTSPTDRSASMAYFYDKIEEERIFQVIEGIIQLASENGMIVVILVDELESLINQDQAGVLTEIVVSRLLRGILDRHPTSVYIAFTCFKETYDQMKTKHYKFYRITERNELKLGDLSEGEKRELTEQILNETIEFTFGKLGANDVLNEFRGTLDFYMSNVVKLIVAKVCEYIDQSEAMWKQVQDIYERNAREQKALPQLLEWGFNRANIKADVETVAGFDFDIFASAADRTTIKMRAFGEIKSAPCSKGWAEKFCGWLDEQILLKSGEYLRERDKLLFIAPDYTADALKLLHARGVECLTYQDVTVNNILKDFEKEKTRGLSPEEQEVIEFLKGTKSKTRALSTMENHFSKDLLEQLARKGIIEIRKTGSRNQVCVKKLLRNTKTTYC